MFLRAFLWAAALVLFVGCAGPAPYVYRYIPGRTATICDGLAVAPEQAPETVRRALEAGNRIVGMPYVYGGGHGSGVPSGYDCSGAASYVLREAGLLNGCMPSKSFRRWGAAGMGRWISLYARKDHVFLVVAGLRFDTGWTTGPKGPQWSTRSRPATGAVIRHPHGW
jgi:hypothetical protein